MKLFDSHCHLTAAAFAGERAEALHRAAEAGVGELVTIASDPADAAEAVRLARAHPGVHASAGLHPHAAEALGDAALADLRRLLAEPEVVAVGETGLDFHYDHAPRGVQCESFEAHLELARETDLPVVVHSREAEEETAARIRAAPGVRGVLHCFTGSARLLEAGLEAGWYVSFSGIVTFRGFDGADLVRRVPDDRLLIETDSPYLAPVPRRGRRNEPALLVHTCAAVAALRGASTEDLAELTRRNARAFYGLS
ncbi:MAG: TatD family hydrolase [Gemmatimonadota bacterium]|nr:TatD family hydrolase [Gemmatimonadota bacterium]